MARKSVAICRAEDRSKFIRSCLAEVFAQCHLRGALYKASDGYLPREVGPGNLDATGLVFTCKNCGGAVSLRPNVPKTCYRIPRHSLSCWRVYKGLLGKDVGGTAHQPRSLCQQRSDKDYGRGRRSVPAR